MPDRILRIVAALLAVSVVGGFALGFINAPQRGRLPGEAPAGGASAPMAAAEALPFNSEELAPPKPPEEEPEEEAKPEVTTENLIPAEKTPPLKIPPVDQAPPQEAAPAPAAPPPPEDPPF